MKIMLSCPHLHRRIVFALKQWLVWFEFIEAFSDGFVIAEKRIGERRGLTVKQNYRGRASLGREPVFRFRYNWGPSWWWRKNRGGGTSVAVEWRSRQLGRFLILRTTLLFVILRTTLLIVNANVFVLPMDEGLFERHFEGTARCLLGRGFAGAFDGHLEELWMKLWASCAN